ncbi:hypothetical protein NLX83_34855 [Allokutzneria sp. A3M-2-11 16]|uniref:hypothetical protein n=1 Tax=Allokutzneria sp. A3M-2-11 16 TaxID=2962043 RepID=UPI0020B73268|nr:hypothetical protein [Allokutzneria sp. A3M-2-11 16]MCP3804461.1 hypothetical protein [Allokutzneria sp. A3M-2-11 16]
MSTPGWQSQQAAQQASQNAQQASLNASMSASRASQQASQRAMDDLSRASRNAHYHRRGGTVGGVIGFVFSLAAAAFMIGLFVLVVERIDPNWFQHILSWIQRLF